MNFTVYSKRLCPYCDKIKKIFEHISITKGFPVLIYELGTDFTSEDFITKFGEDATFPQVMVNNVSLGGLSKTVKYLMENRLI